VVVNIPEEIKEQMLHLCSQMLLADSIAIWLLIKGSKNGKLILKEGVELQLYNSFLSALCHRPYIEVAKVLNYLLNVEYGISKI